MTTRPYELLARFGNDGTIAGVHVRTITTVNGRDFESDPLPLADTKDPAFQSFVTQFSASVVAERDALRTEKQAFESQLSEKTAEVASLISQVATLTEQLEALRNPPGPDVTTREGLKAYLAQRRYEKEIAGFTVGGQLISTNRDELAHWFARFFDAFNHLQGNASASGGVYPYKPRGGTSVINLTAAQAVRAYQCLAWYVNACIATEGQLIATIDAATLSQLVDIKEAIDAEATWPQRTFEWVPS